ncbi:MAG: macro domain-containing protein [Woeseiaceae bacterium]|nr:macro domain-containing protein [Woeseiaceae bacterium]
MSKTTLNGVTLECLRGDIANQPDMDAIVNAANAALEIGGGVAGAIHRAAGPGLAAEARPMAPIRPGQAVITGAHDLPNRHVIHCLGPVYGHDEPSDELLAECYRNALQLAHQHGIASIAFPAISTGAFGYPAEPAASIALRTILAETENLSPPGHIRFVLFSAGDLQIYEDTIRELSDSA